MRKLTLLLCVLLMLVGTLPLLAQDDDDPPDTLDEVVQAYNERLANNDPPGAISVLTDALAAGIDDPQVYRLMAQTYVNTGDVGSAIVTFNLALERYPDDDTLLINRALLYAHSGYPSLARADLQTLDALRGEGSYPLQRATIFELSGDTPAAAEAIALWFRMVGHEEGAPVPIHLDEVLSTLR